MTRAHKKPPEADISRLQGQLAHALQAKTDSEQRYDLLANLSVDAVLLCSAGVLKDVNDAALKMLGANTAEQMLAQPIIAFIEAQEWGEMLQAVANQGATNSATAFTPRELTRLDGTPVCVDVAASACVFQGRPAVQLVLRDVAELRQLETRLIYLTQYDELTELPNRSQFRARLEGAMVRATRNRQMMCLMFIGMDHFQGVNATQGQGVGDLVLKQIAERLRSSARKSDTVARVGGVEFCVILEGVADQQGATVAARRELASLSRPMLLDGATIRMTASIGLNVFPPDAQDSDALLRGADVAMYHAKDCGGNNFQFYSLELNARTQRDELRRAETENRLARLTPREHEVLDMVVSGKANKMVAYLLGTSTRTIDNHRASIMDKMLADSLPELVRMRLDLRAHDTHSAATPAARV
jgi:diguanylate cyclase (GGDEF)-like protein/PAS domain S-box-containing protein